MGSFNQRARDSSSLERTKRTTDRLDKRFVVFFVLYGIFGACTYDFLEKQEVIGTESARASENFSQTRGRFYALPFEFEPAALCFPRILYFVWKA